MLCYNRLSLKCATAETLYSCCFDLKYKNFYRKLKTDMTYYKKNHDIFFYNVKIDK